MPFSIRYRVFCVRDTRKRSGCHSERQRVAREEHVPGRVENWIADKQCRLRSGTGDEKWVFGIREVAYINAGRAGEVI
jgi:hypothetical protein